MKTLWNRGRKNSTRGISHNRYLTQQRYLTQHREQRCDRWDLAETRSKSLSDAARRDCRDDRAFTRIKTIPLVIEFRNTEITLAGKSSWFQFSRFLLSFRGSTQKQAQFRKLYSNTCDRLWRGKKDIPFSLDSLSTSLSFVVWKFLCAKNKNNYKTYNN